MTPKQREIAARMIEARKVTINGDTDPDTMAAAAFVFDQGIFFLGESGMAEIVKMLREPAEEPTP